MKDVDVLDRGNVDIETVKDMDADKDVPTSCPGIMAVVHKHFNIVELNHYRYLIMGLMPL